MSVFKQRGFIRILRFAVIAAFALFLLISLSRAEEPGQEPNQSTEAQSSLQDSSDHMNHSAPTDSSSTGSTQKVDDQSSQMHDANSGHMKAPDDAGSVKVLEDSPKSDMGTMPNTRSDTMPDSMHNNGHEIDHDSMHDSMHETDTGKAGEMDHDSMGHSQMGTGQNEAGQSGVNNTDSDATDNAGHSLHINTKNREGSVLPPNDGSVPDMSGHVHPTPAPDSVEAGVTERLGETITTPIYFTDSTGKRVNIRSLMTSPVLIAPVYYSCPGVCHILMSSIAAVLPSVRLSPDKDYRIIMVSFDELDTPELAAKKKKNFMHALHATDPSFPPDAWQFLTGDKQSIDTLMKEIGFRFKRIGKDFVHPVILVAVSPEGMITRYLYGTNILPFDVTMALTESETDTPLFSVQRIAQLCFSYDPKGKKYVFDTMKIAGFGVIGFVVILALILSFGGKKKRKKVRKE